PEAIPDSACPFVVPEVALDEHLDETRQYLREADAIRWPHFRNIAMEEVKNRLKPYQKRQIADFRQSLRGAVTATHSGMRQWYELKYEHHIRDVVCNIFDQLKQSLKQSQVVNKGTVSEDEHILGLLGDLRLYQAGLNELESQRNELFQSINKVSKDIKTINVHGETDEHWYQEGLLNLFRQNDQARTWEAILDDQTSQFFQFLSARNVSEGRFRYLFDVCRRAEAREPVWLRLGELLDDFCEKQVERFMTGKNAETEVRIQLERAAISNGRLLETARLSDSWIAPSNVGANLGVARKAIAIPDPLNTPTANEVKQGVPNFGTAELHQGEDEEIVFYNELGAFPLFRIGSLPRYKEHYLRNIRSQRFMRHIDLRLIDKLRDIVPPLRESEIDAMYKSGLMVLEALLLGCFRIRGGGLEFHPEGVGANPLPSVVLPAHVQDIAKFFGASDRDVERYREELANQIEQRRDQIIDQYPDYNFLMYRLLWEYRESICPVLLRHSELGGMAEQQTYLSILVNGLLRQYQPYCVEDTRQSEGKEMTERELDRAASARMKSCDLSSCTRSLDTIDERDAVASLVVFHLSGDQA
ncbi:hypothetical protein N8198_06735, partial [Gammaproteobacteria bacterium]|nr:hypothetical protein [Gammaproteobacteria bacterium]